MRHLVLVLFVCGYLLGCDRTKPLSLEHPSDATKSIRGLEKSIGILNWQKDAKADAGEKESEQEGAHKEHKAKEQFCNGFLVAPDVVVTAARCVVKDVRKKDTQENCEGLYISFEPKGTKYFCEKIIKQQRAQRAGYAVIKLEKEAQNVRPLDVAEEPFVSEGAEVFGVLKGGDTYKYEIFRSKFYALGDSYNVYTNGDVEAIKTDRDISKSNMQSCFTNSDVNHSGSPVFDAKTEQVIGVFMSAKGTQCNGQAHTYFYEGHALSAAERFIGAPHDSPSGS